KAQLELERGYRLTKQDLLAFIQEILKGDINDKDYQKQIIDHLVSQVFVSDDDTVVYFNIRGGKEIETLTIDDTKNAVKKVQTRLPLARHMRFIETDIDFFRTHARRYLTDHFIKQFVRRVFTDQ
ncbi:MAG: hypothetical protein ACI4SH_05115, partial [Candidatus Scatosoma sp.]